MPETFEVTEYDDLHHMIRVVGKPIGTCAARNYIPGDYLLIRHVDNRRLTDLELSTFLKTLGDPKVVIDWDNIHNDKLQAEYADKILYKTPSGENRIWVTFHTTMQEDERLLHYLYERTTTART